MEQLITWRSNTKLSCAGCAPSDVIICVPQAFVAHPDTEFQPSFITGRLVSSVVTRGTCNNVSYKYAIAYDDAQITTGYILTCQDITGVFCEGCLSQWVEDRFALLPETDITAVAPLTSTGGPDAVVSTSMNTDRLIGRGTAGIGVMEEITLGTNLSLTGNVLNAAGGGGGGGTVTDNGDRTFTFTPTVGPSVDWCQGVETLNTTSGNPEFGVGAGYTLNELTFTDPCTLEINSTRDHGIIHGTASAIVTNFDTLGIPGQIEAADGLVVGTQVATFFITNTLLRDVIISLSQAATFVFSLTGGSNLRYAIQLDIDGGGFLDQIVKLLPGATGSFEPYIDPLAVPTVNIPLASGASITLTTRITLQATANPLLISDMNIFTTYVANTE